MKTLRNAASRHALAIAEVIGFALMSLGLAFAWLPLGLVAGGLAIVFLVQAADGAK